MTAISSIDFIVATIEENIPQESHEKDTVVGSHNFEYFPILIDDRNNLYVISDRSWLQEFEVKRVWYVPNPWSTVYFGKHLVDYDMGTRGSKIWTQVDAKRIRDSLKHLPNAEHY